MAQIEVVSGMELESPVLVEGLPGVGLVGKIAADHLVETFDMDHYASCHCDGLPKVSVYQEGNSSVRPPVRIYGDEERELLVLKSDVPVSPERASSFSTCVTGWLADQDVTPIYLSGLAQEKDGVPDMYGISTGEGDRLLSEHGIDSPSESGLVSGPTGALLADASAADIDSVGLIVQANKQFPDPEAARILIANGIEPIADIEVGTEQLVEQAEEIAQARENLAKRMQEAEEESSQAQPLRMYQ
jgi:uncharacterized protein